MKNSELPAMPNTPSDFGYVDTKTQGATKREYFASRAPEEIPLWFYNMFEARDLPEALTFTSEEVECIQAYKDGDYCTENYEKGQDLYNKQLVRDKEIGEQWETQLYFAWRVYYADMLLKELQGD